MSEWSSETVTSSNNRGWTDADVKPRVTINLIRYCRHSGSTIWLMLCRWFGTALTAIWITFHAPFPPKRESACDEIAAACRCVIVFELEIKLQFYSDVEQVGIRKCAWFNNEYNMSVVWNRIKFFDKLQVRFGSIKFCGNENWVQPQHDRRQSIVQLNTTLLKL